MLHENTMPYRSYYVPASACMGALVHDREKSDRIEFLNGNWKFRFYESIYDLQEKFYEESYDTNEFGEIPVPGIWQNFGYDEHQYTNVRYPIPLDPPYVPQDNPCGAYVHEFEYEKDEYNNVLIKKNNCNKTPLILQVHTDLFRRLPGSHRYR